MKENRTNINVVHTDKLGWCGHSHSQLEAPSVLFIEPELMNHIKNLEVKKTLELKSYDYLFNHSVGFYLDLHEQALKKN